MQNGAFKEVIDEEYVHVLPNQNNVKCISYLTPQHIRLPTERENTSNSALISFFKYVFKGKRNSVATQRISKLMI